MKQNKQQRADKRCLFTPRVPRTTQPVDENRVQPTSNQRASTPRRWLHVQTTTYTRFCALRAPASFRSAPEAIMYAGVPKLSHGKRNSRAGMFNFPQKSEKNTLCSERYGTAATRAERHNIRRLRGVCARTAKLNMILQYWGP